MRTPRGLGKGLGANMRAARVAQGLGLRDLARQVGMSPSSLSEFEHGKSLPGRPRLEALSAVLDVPLHEEPPAEDEVRIEHWREFEPLDLGPVFEAALDIFVEHGYHGATVRMIAERCDLSASGVYAHVASKHDLLRRLLQRAMTELNVRCAAAEAEGRTPEERLANQVEALVLFHIVRRSWAYLASREVRSLEPGAREQLMEARRTVRERLQHTIADCRAGREEPVVPDEQTARAIVTMCVAVADWYEAGSGGKPQDVVTNYVALAITMAEATPPGLDREE